MLVLSVENSHGEQKNELVHLLSKRIVGGQAGILRSPAPVLLHFPQISGDLRAQLDHVQRVITDDAQASAL